MPALSLILCSRNDQYMGNSCWRLTTALKYVAQKIHELGREKDVEVLVADWGSEVPLRDVLELSPAAARIVSFISIPPAIARGLRKDSPFPEVLALNAAARRARGEYIGRIDQDTLIGRRFLKFFFDVYEGRRQLDVPLNSALLFANQRMLPYRFGVRCPSFSVVNRFVNWFGRFLTVENALSSAPFYSAGVGIWLLHRTLWSKCGGYDERMIYMNGMETNMILRLLQKHPIVNLGKLVNYDFYHLEHYHPWVIRKSSTHRNVNPHLPFSRPEGLNPNGDSWGLREYPLQILFPKKLGELPTMDTAKSRVELLSFIMTMLHAGPQIVWDTLALSVRDAYIKWTRRARIAAHTIGGKPLRTWPGLVRKLWAEKNLA